ncbi:MAG TPA: hypothetical protein VF363_02020, partial [Candidatus Eisenbacteria bacterium]
RIREARERLGLSRSFVAASLGLQDSLYWDVEFHDDEVFTNFSIGSLARLASILQTPLCALLFGLRSEAPAARTSFASVAQRLKALTETEGLSTGELEERVGWELEGVFADPEALSTFTVAGLRDLCDAVGVDWVTALPSPA